MLFAVVVLSTFKSNAQCPVNIDFEDGTFNRWTTWKGNVALVNNANVITLNVSPAPVPGSHTMLSSNPGDGLDSYGNFPKNCPNGSGHSIQLGNNVAGRQAEGVSYRFTIPATQNKFSLIYYYAVVFQDFGHPREQQPKLEIEIKNLTDNSTIGCSSFSFIATSGLPGFFQSSNPQGPTPVWCKDWSATSINLDGNAGKTIQLFFKTADCTAGGHFGYAYVDVNTECSSSFIGATFCSDDTAINITAPFGYQNYTWFTSDFRQVLGNQQSLNLQPPPTSGSMVAVELIPYNGYGCKDTLYAKLLDTLTVVANAGPDKIYCSAPVQIGGPPRQGLVYKWSPAAGLSNPNISNPTASPGISTRYVLKVTNSGGGCPSTDTVLVSAGSINESLQIIGGTTSCTLAGQNPNTILQVFPTDSIQWFKDGVAIADANQTQYVVLQSGSYNAMLFTKTGCSKSTVIQQINIFIKPVAGFTINNTTQCFAQNQFVFTNTSSPVSNLQYSWNLGDGNTATSKDVTHAYAQSGTYMVTLVVIGAGGCADSISYSVIVNPTPTADFSVSPVCINLNVPLINKTINNTTSTINYLWDFGNGQISSARDPVYNYSTSGTYNIKLTVSTAQCPASFNTIQNSVVIDAPLPGFRYPVKDAVINYPLKLQARVFGNSILWSPPINLDNPRIYTPVFKGLTDQLYTIQIKTISGCVTVDTQMVKTIKKIEIYVPTVFTPNGDGLNDYLRPVLMGFKKVNYFRVYNRWGQLLFQMNSDYPGWNGMVKGVLQDMQAIVWMIEAEDVDGIIHQKKGSSVIMR
ncbi:MAG: PKD domain-containing protein [Chitinophagaceae bacterium]|nr:PKD domain-containing protein [Chitinophagaceae bacterium]